MIRTDSVAGLRDAAEIVNVSGASGAQRVPIFPAKTDSFVDDIGCGWVIFSFADSGVCVNCRHGLHFEATCLLAAPYVPCDLGLF